MLSRPAALPAVLLLAGLLASSAWAGPSVPPDLEVFVREGCPHCVRAKTFLNELARERPSLRIAAHDVGREPDQLERLTRLAADRGLQPVGVPAFLIQDELLIGFQDAATTGAALRRLLDRAAEPARDAGLEGIAARPFGPLDVRALGLPLFTITMGLLDGFNPCAMWLLLFLLSLLVQLHNRRTMILVAGTFVLVSGLVYFVFMAAWLNLFLLIGLARPTELVLGLIAILIGAVHVKDFLAFGAGWSLSIPAAAKPGLYARMRQVIQAEHLGGALAAVALLAVLVNIVELLCTAGFPAVYTRILTMQDLPTWQYYGYLALYNLAYITDDGLMVALAVTALSRRRLQEREGRWLKLVSGLVMVSLGLILLLRPEWLH